MSSCTLLIEARFFIRNRKKRLQNCHKKKEKQNSSQLIRAVDQSLRVKCITKKEKQQRRRRKRNYRAKMIQERSIELDEKSFANRETRDRIYISTIFTLYSAEKLQNFDVSL